MKQVIFAIALLAMASLTGCLTDDSSNDGTTDTTSDNTGNTNQDGTIDPVGTDGGYTPPEDSSIFIDYGEPGWWSCDENGDNCEFTFVDSDGWHADETYYQYYDADSEQSELDFQGWVNKTGKTITIEGFYNPIDDIGINPDGTGIEEKNATGRGICHTYGYNMQYSNYCTIELYGQGSPYDNHPLEYTFILSLGKGYYSSSDRTVIPLTITIELPFEPVLFKIKSESNEDKSITRAF